MADNQPIPCFMVDPVWEEIDDKKTVKHWIRPDTGETHEHLHQFGPGAMWYAVWIEEHLRGTDEYWLHHYHFGPDGRVLGVQTPGGTWIIDSRCSNCTRKDDATHHCWCRHGTPPQLTVDKIPEAGGSTCAAGAGSIQCGSWHGFLRNGFLTL